MKPLPPVTSIRVMQAGAAQAGESSSHGNHSGRGCNQVGGTSSGTGALPLLGLSALFARRRRSRSKAS